MTVQGLNNTSTTAMSQKSTYHKPFFSKKSFNIATIVHIEKKIDRKKGIGKMGHTSEKELKAQENKGTY